MSGAFDRGASADVAMSMVRASLAPYNTVDDVDALCAALLRMQAGRSPKPA